jgi:hypothetical protein
MLINEIVIVEFRFDPNKVVNTKGPDGQLYTWDKIDQSFTAPNGQQVQSNGLLYRQLIKANPKATGKIPGGVLRKAARAVGLGGVGKATRSDPKAGIMQKTLGTVGDAIGKGLSSIASFGKNRMQKGTAQSQPAPAQAPAQAPAPAPAPAQAPAPAPKPKKKKPSLILGPDGKPLQV